jgi:arginine-tRNA-protein transferase
MDGVLVDCGECPYLPGRRFHAFHPMAWRADDYRTLVDRGFRRSGAHLYRPLCPHCDACRTVRVDCPAFTPRTDQRRTRARNADLTVTAQPRGLDDERRELYRRYQASVHAREADDPTPFLLADGGQPGCELHAREAAGRLLAVSVLDVWDDALSSVYCYYDPAARRRGLGTFLALAEIAHAVATGRRWLYLGFLVRGCAKMEYKARYLPQEELVDGRWVRREG